MAGLGKPPPILSATPRELRRQAGISPAVPQPTTVNTAPRIKPSAPSLRDYGKNPPLLNPANLGRMG
jgi:hypothetical protein